MKKLLFWALLFIMLVGLAAQSLAEIRWPLTSFPGGTIGKNTLTSPTNHNGIDVIANEGTPIYAGTSGTAYYRINTKVINGATYYVNYGKYVFLSFDNGSAYYAHMSRFSDPAENAIPVTLRSLPSYGKGVEVVSNATLHSIYAQSVSEGSLLGYIGNTGNSNPAHLHYELRNPGLVWPANAPYNVPVSTHSHSFTYNRPNVDHESQGHRAIYRCTSCNYEEGKEHWITTKVEGCLTCYPSGGSSSPDPRIVMANFKSSSVKSGDSVDVYVKTNAAVTRVELINEIGEHTGGATGHTTNNGSEKEWDFPWKTEKVGSRTMKLRAHANGKTTDYTLYITVTSAGGSGSNTQVLFATERGNGGQKTTKSATVDGNAAYCYCQVSKLGLPNDSISYIQIPSGWKVIAFQDDRYNGTRWVIDSTRDLYNEQDNAISSYIIVPSSTSNDWKPHCSDCSPASSKTPEIVLGYLTGTLMKGNQVNVNAVTNADVTSVALINQNGTTVASTTSYSNTKEGNKSFLFFWKPDTVGSYIVKIRAYAGTKYIDKDISVSVKEHSTSLTWEKYLSQATLLTNKSFSLFDSPPTLVTNQFSSIYLLSGSTLYNFFVPATLGGKTVEKAAYYYSGQWQFVSPRNYIDGTQIYIQVAGTTASNVINVSSVSLNRTTASVDKGKTLTLSATISPSTATNKSIVWKSSNTSVATVSSSGVVAGVAAGNAVISATTVDGNKYAQCSISVSVPVVRVSSVKLNKATANVTKGKTLTLSATVSPSTANNKAVTWKSSNTKIATVTSNGTVKGIKVGKATITATTKDGSKVAKCTINVRTPVSSVKLSKKTLTFTENKAQTLKATVSPSNAFNKAVTWKSSNTKVATVSSSGSVKPIGAGTATITATAKDGSGKKITCKVTVKSSAINSAPYYSKYTSNACMHTQSKKFTLYSAASGGKGTSITPTMSNPIVVRKWGKLRSEVFIGSKKGWISTKELIVNPSFKPVSKKVYQNDFSAKVGTAYWKYTNVAPINGTVLVVGQQGDYYQVFVQYSLGSSLLCYTKKSNIR